MIDWRYRNDMKKKKGANIKWQNKKIIIKKTTTTTIWWTAAIAHVSDNRILYYKTKMKRVDALFMAKCINCKRRRRTTRRRSVWRRAVYNIVLYGRSHRWLCYLVYFILWIIIIMILLCVLYNKYNNVRPHRVRVSAAASRFATIVLRGGPILRRRRRRRLRRRRRRSSCGRFIAVRHTISL